MNIHGEYDGIQEEDNHLPNWWLAILFVTIVFGFGYWFVFHTLHAAESPNEEFARVAAEQKKQLALTNPVSNESLLALVKSSAAVADGKKTFTTVCVACHRADAGGSVGPNLTDRYWIHGAKPENLLAAVTVGYPDKGMPAWAGQLGPERTRNVVAFVLSVRGTNVEGGKAPQGNPED